MKRILASILAFIYLLVAIPAVYGQPDCEGGCDEIKQVKTEDHHRTTTAGFKLDPLAPAVGMRSGQVQVAVDVMADPSRYAFLFSNKIPLFVRHCNFRI